MFSKSITCIVLGGAGMNLLSYKVERAIGMKVLLERSRLDE